MFAGRIWGWNTLLSDQFSVGEDGDRFVFEGQGFGHRVGLCQAGAKARLDAGWTLEAVLGHYFPGASVAGLEKSAAR